MIQAEYHKRVPRTAAENRQYRDDLLKFAEKSKSFQETQRQMCKADFLYYVNAYCDQYNPKHIGDEFGPFMTWPFQEVAANKILDHILRQRDLVIEKSREVGASWLCLLIEDWMMKFWSGKKFLLVSRSAEAVDQPGDSDCLFWKLDFIRERQPAWLLPKIRRKRMLISADNGSSITGQASTGKAGVGGRATAMFIDEFSQIREAYDLMSQTSDTSCCRIYNFTHLGPGNAAYELSQRPNIAKVVMHWSEHPEKNVGLYMSSAHPKLLKRGPYRFPVKEMEHVNIHKFPSEYQFVKSGKPLGGPFPGLRSPWYDNEVLRRNSDRNVAINLDINAQGATSQFFDAGLINDLIREFAMEPKWIGDLKHSSQGRFDEKCPLVANPDGRVHLWFLPLANGHVPAARYAVGTDNSEGVGATPTTITVINVDCGEKWLEIADPFLGPVEAASLTVALCRLFRNREGHPARLCWESRGPGLKFGKNVERLGFSNVYWRRSEVNWSNRGHPTNVAGWNPTAENKRLLLADYLEALASRKLLNRSEPALRECLDFSYDGPDVVNRTSYGGEDPSGSGANHADRVVADALGWMLALELGLTPRQVIEEQEAPILSLGWRRNLWKEDQHAKEQEMWQ